MQNAHPTQPQQPLTQPASHSLGGAILDAQGQEIPITEQMVQQACRELDNAWLPLAAREATAHRYSR